MLERELTAKAATILQPDAPIYYLDLFAIGAANRTLAQSRGFRAMIESGNFPSAAVLLRTQIDTVMRVNGIKYLDNPEDQLSRVFKGTSTFRQLVSCQKTRKGKPIRMQDSFLLEKLQEDEPWIEEIYRQTSDFVHLSFRHLYSSIKNIEDEGQIFHLEVSGEDNAKDETAYYEICDAFFSVSKLTCTGLLALLTALHAAESSHDD